MHIPRGRGLRAPSLALLAAAIVAVAFLQAADKAGAAPIDATRVVSVVATAGSSGPIDRSAEAAAGQAAAAPPGVTGTEPIGQDPIPTAGPQQVVESQAPRAPVAAAYGVRGVDFVGNVPFTQYVSCGQYSCQVQLDVYVPTGPGPYPVAVLVRGGPGGLGGRTYLDFFASELASRGVLVFNADYRDTATQGGGYPAAFQDVACAVRFARSDAGLYDGDAGPVTLVGHSLGGWVGSVVALDPTEFQGGCLAGGSGRPDAFVGLAGNYVLEAGEVSSDLATFFGGSPAQTAKTRAASNPFNYANGSQIPVRLVAGTSDGTVNPAASVSLETFLATRGWNVTLQLVPGANHMSIMRTDDAPSAASDAVFSAMAAARSAADAIDPIRARSRQ
ncbi:MAG: alpha/beta hydrolase family protein [Candidatus Limnocylindrales bacterium]